MEYKESQDESESAATSDESEEESGIDMFTASTLARNRIEPCFWQAEYFLVK